MFPVVLFTGLSGSGKTTLCSEVFKALLSRDIPTEMLDGDVMRRLLSPDLGFSPEDRWESVRRISRAAQQSNRDGKLVLISVIAPFRELRREIRREHPLFLEIFVDAPLSVCESRDPKGLYRRARNGELAEFTGISSPYEEPLSPELTCSTAVTSLPDCTELVLRAIEHLMQQSSKRTAAA